MVDTADSKSATAMCMGSSPISGIKTIIHNRVMVFIF
jgi:hypothetical protein